MLPGVASMFRIYDFVHFEFGVMTHATRELVLKVYSNVPSLILDPTVFNTNLNCQVDCCWF